MSKNEEIAALYKEFVTTGRPPSFTNPQWLAELNAINQKYGAPKIDATGQPENTQQQQQQQQQQQTTTQDTGALANVGTGEDVGALANVGTDDQPEKEYAYLTSDTGAKTIGSGKTRVYMRDEVTGQTFVYSKDPGDDEGFEGLSPQYYNIDPSNLKISSVLTKTGSEGSWEKQDIGDNLYFGGGVDPGTAAKRSAEANKDDKSDNDVFYDVTTTDPVTGEEKTTTYVDVTGTGQSIPVGATNITRDPNQLGAVVNVGTKDDPVYETIDKDPSTYTQPVLHKGWSGYHATKEAADADIAKNQPQATTSITEALTSPFVEGGQGSGQFDLGAYFGMDVDPNTGTSSLVMSNPDSSNFDLEKFFNQTESLGTQNFLRSQSTDVLNDIIKEGNFLDALLGRNFELPDGTMYYDKIYQPGYQAGFDADGNYQVTGDAIQGFDMDQLESFFSNIGEKNPTTGDMIYSNTGYGIDPYNITGTDNQGLQYDYAYSQRPLTAQAVRAYKGGLGPYANVGYLTRYGYNPEIGDEILRYDEASGLYFDPVTGLPIPPENLEGFALGDPETVELQGTEDVYRGQMTTNPTTGEQLYYDADGNPVTEEEYLTFTDPMETGVT
jgi:hypothetical protein